MESLFLLGLFAVFVLICLRWGHGVAGIVILAALFISRKLCFLDLIKYVDWNVIAMYVSMYVLSDLFSYSKLPALITQCILKRTTTPYMALLGVCIISSFMSTVIENAACVLMLAPVVFDISKRFNVSPVPTMIGVAVCSNLQGCATLVGDLPSLLLATFANLNFADFFWLNGKPGIFFAVQLGAILGFFVLGIMFKRIFGAKLSLEHNVSLKSHLHIRTWGPSICFGFFVISLFVWGFFPRPELYMAICGILWAGVCIMWTLLNGSARGRKLILARLVKTDLKTPLFLITAFCLVGLMKDAGVLSAFARMLAKLSSSNALTSFGVIAGISSIVSSLIDNTPYQVAMMPVVSSLALSCGMAPITFLLGLFVSTSLGGNLTPIGANSNLACMGVLRAKGFKLKFSEFFKIGFWFSFGSLIVGCSFIWMAIR